MYNEITGIDEEEPSSTGVFALKYLKALQDKQAGQPAFNLGDVGSQLSSTHMGAQGPSPSAPPPGLAPDLRSANSDTPPAEFSRDMKQSEAPSMVNPVLQAPAEKMSFGDKIRRMFSGGQQSAGEVDEYGVPIPAQRKISPLGALLQVGLPGLVGLSRGEGGLGFVTGLNQLGEANMKQRDAAQKDYATARALAQKAEYGRTKNEIAAQRIKQQEARDKAMQDYRNEMLGIGRGNLSVNQQRVANEANRVPKASRESDADRYARVAAAIAAGRTNIPRQDLQWANVYAQLHKLGEYGRQ